jgi:hypothetical protein
MLDARLDKGRGYTNRIEGGDIAPPAQDMCLAMGRALELTDPNEVWQRSAPERLRRLHPDLADWAVDLDARAATTSAVIADLNAQLAALRDRIAAIAVLAGEP